MGKKKSSKAAPDIDELEETASAQPQETLTVDAEIAASVKKPAGKARKGKGKKGKGRDWDSEDDELPQVTPHDEEDAPAPVRPKQSKKPAAAASFALLEEEDDDDDQAEDSAEPSQARL